MTQKQVKLEDDWLPLWLDSKLLLNVGWCCAVFLQGKVWLLSNVWSTWGCSKGCITYCCSIATGCNYSHKGGIIWTMSILAFGIPGNGWMWLGACEWGTCYWKVACWLYKDWCWFMGPSWVDNWWLFCVCLWDEWVICWCWMKAKWETWLDVRCDWESCAEKCGGWIWVFEEACWIKDICSRCWSCPSTALQDVMLTDWAFSC